MSTDLSHRGLQLLPDLTGSSLHTLKADHNAIASLSRLPYSLQVLLLAQNKLTFVGTLDSLVPDLRELDIRFNRLIALDGITSLSKLEKLWVAHNFIGDDQVNLLANLKRLKVLDISCNHLRDARLMSVLERLPDLQVLVNKGNDFSFAVFNFSLPNLRQLTLDSNKLKLLQFDAEANYLQMLSAKSNLIQKIEGLARLTALTELYLDDNQVKNLGEEFNYLRKLRILSARGNQMHRVTQLVLPALETLDLAKNLIHTFSDCCLPVLQELVLDDNRLSQVPILESPLKVLYLMNNNLANLAGIEKYVLLEELMTAGNPIVEESARRGPHYTEFAEDVERASFAEVLSGLGEKLGEENVDVASQLVLSAEFTEIDSLQGKAVSEFDSLFEQSERSLAEQIYRLEQETKRILEQPLTVRDNNASRSSDDKRRSCYRKYRKTHEHSAKTPLTTDQAVSPQHSLLGDQASHVTQLIASALTAPRPILAAEADSPIVCTLNSKHSEFLALRQHFAPFSVTRASKVYTYSQVQAFKRLERQRFDETFQQGNALELLMFVGTADEFVRVCNSPQGFSLLRRKVKFTEFYVDSSTALLCIVRTGLKTVVLDSPSWAVPAYLVRVAH